MCAWAFSHTLPLSLLCSFLNLLCCRCGVYTFAFVMWSQCKLCHACSDQENLNRLLWFVVSAERVWNSVRHCDHVLCHYHRSVLLVTVSPPHHKPYELSPFSFSFCPLFILHLFYICPLTACLTSFDLLLPVKGSLKYHSFHLRL